MIQDSRIQQLNEADVNARGAYVLYWMQQSQRVRFNHALEHAIERANELKLPPLVVFGLMDDYPEANERHYAFMLEGLREVESDLRKRGIKFIIARGRPDEVAVKFAKNAAIVVCDRGYLLHQKRWRDHVADHARCRVEQVESDVVVPVEVASDKPEFAVRTIRPKIQGNLDEYLKPLKARRVLQPSLNLKIASELSLDDLDVTLKKLKLDRSVARTSRLIGGASRAKKLLDQFIARKLAGYDDHRNEPSLAATSFMSAYLHFGQISALEIALRVRDASAAPQAARDSYIEELIVRRELSMNFVNFTSNYDTFDMLPNWAKKTLAGHARDKRERLYTLQELEDAQTHDRWWNAAQMEMTRTGFMHNYMRMYWGKKIIEWTKSPTEAYERVLHLNNKYFLDGRDPVSFANVGWILGLHDRPWGPARKIFGTVRYMNAAGLERKFDMDAYVKFVESFS